MEKEYTENDWKLFQSKVPGWQEAYMDKLNHEYVSILCDDDVSASEKFWPVCDRIKDDQHHAGVLITMSRSEMIGNLVSLLMEKAISIDDLEGFSDGLRERVKSLADSYEGD